MVKPRYVDLRIDNSAGNAAWYGNIAVATSVGGKLTYHQSAAHRMAWRHGLSVGGLLCNL